MHFCTPTKYLLFTVIVLSFLLNGAQAVCSKYPPEKSTYINVNNPEKSTCINFEVVNQPTGSGQYAAQTSGVYQSGPNNEKNLFNAFDGNDNTGYTVQDFNYNSCTNGLCSYSGASPVPNNGDWIQLTLPHPITLTGFFLASYSTTRMATSGNVQGSNDDFKTSYTIIGYFGYQTTPQSTLTVPMASSIPYKSYRLVVSRVGNDKILSITSFYLIGCDASPTYSPTLAPTTYSPSSVPTATPSSVFPSTSLPSSLSTALIPAIQLPTCKKGWTVSCSCQWIDKNDHVYEDSSPVTVDSDSTLSWDALYNNFSLGSAVVGGVVIAALYECTRYVKSFSKRSEYAPIVDHE